MRQASRLQRISIALAAAWLLLGLAQPARANDLPPAAYISGVSGYAQSYVLSCESRAAADWAGFWGVSISETDFLNNLPRSDNPDAGFVGHPNDPWGNLPPLGYGVHAPPVAALLRQYGLTATSGSGLTWDDLRAEVAAGRPVIVWVVGQMWPGAAQRYTSSDGQVSRVARYEHTMMLIGYDITSVYVIDSYSGSYVSYPLDAFLTSWGTLGNMAVYAGAQADSTPALPPGAGGEYTVQRGEYLSALAVRFGVSWLDLATANGIAEPYLIYAGQKLTIPGGQPAAASLGGAQTRFWLPLIQRNSHSRPPVRPSTPTQPARPATYTVQAGEYLFGIANSQGLDWRTLAVLNELEYPFMVYPGQTLRLR